MTDNERLFRIIWPDRCWHTIIEQFQNKVWICSCGLSGKGASSRRMHLDINVILSHSDEIAAAMMEKGLWEEFVKWHFNMCSPQYTDNATGLTAYLLHIWAHAEILVIPELLKRAIIAWWEGK